MSKAIVTIVEGHGEVAAVEALLAKIIAVWDEPAVHVVRPLRKHRDEVVQPEKLEQAIQLAIRLKKNAAAILVLLDADDACPAKLGPELHERARKVTHLPVAVVLAKREFEAWFLGCKESFRGFMGIPDDAAAPEDPEGLDAKSRLRRNMGGAKYNPRLHQVRFVRKMGFDLCRERCPSFDKLLRDVEYLVSEMKKSQQSDPAK
jgi:hypothetical protein